MHGALVVQRTKPSQRREFDASSQLKIPSFFALLLLLQNNMMDRLAVALLMAIAAAMAFFPATANRCTDRIFDASSSTVAHYQYLGRNGTTMVDSLSRYHLNPTEESTWMNILPRKAGQPVVTELDWAMLYRAVKRPGLKSAANGGNFLKEISLRDVRVDPSSVHGRAQQTNLEYLLLLDVDRLVWSFRKLAGLPTPGEPYLGWEDPNGQLRGHFVGDELALKPILDLVMTMYTFD
ncbi:DUF1680 domain containing protein [Musa troglodytarum]|uniref:DUF1680 domain containing protein n=1 Tax=Musa troglodytarum TaxID=320322 RepID=A0A9E7GPV2_9LILI|nr:DUF1680 domain containing protein [Musa troglodytarum]